MPRLLDGTLPDIDHRASGVIGPHASSVDVAASSRTSSSNRAAALRPVRRTYCMDAANALEITKILGEPVVGGLVKKIS